MRFPTIWDFHNGRLAEEEWKENFQSANGAARKALANHDTAETLGIILSRMCTLRNQLIHGGATWNSSVNREQLRDCTAFLGKLVLFVVHVMMGHSQTLWGEACYPVVESG